MKTGTSESRAVIVVVAALLSLAGGTAFAGKEPIPLTPELAAKKENHRKQNEQRITQEQRKAAAEALKAERLKVYKAKEAVRQSTPPVIDVK